MNWLAYLSLIFATTSLFLRRPWSISVAGVSATCGLLSAIIRHWDLVQKATTSFFAKVVIAGIAAAALFVSPWIANTVISEITLLRASAFPAAYSAVQYIATVFLWAILLYCAVSLCAAYNLLQILRGAAVRVAKRPGKTETLASLGRLAGLLVLLFYLAPLFLKVANHDSRGIMTHLVVSTAFVENLGQSTSIASIHPQFPSDCKRLAAEAKLDLTRVYVCSARTIRCSNINETTRIAYLNDTDVVVATNIDRSTALYELNPVRFDVMKCDTNHRYEYRVEQEPASVP